MRDPQTAPTGGGTPDDPILGGDTPFVPASEAWRVFGPDHKPVHFYVDGKEMTRPMQVAILAMSWNLYAGKEAEMHGLTHREFMRQMIAAANHDLRALGVGPLISISEIERVAPQYPNPEDTSHV